MKKLKVWMKPCHLYGASIHNVSDQYRDYAPDEKIEWVDDWLSADLCIDHLIGTPSRENLVHPLERDFSEEVKIRLEMAQARVIKVAYVMHCSIIEDEFYKAAFANAIMSTGFLDVSSLFKFNSEFRIQDRWLRVPWGVSTEDFLLPLRKEEPEFTIYTWGASADPEEELLETVYEACKRVNGKMLHSGYDYKFDDGKNYFYLPPAKTKQEVAERYNMCKFSNAMRREDGFELANIEAPLANSRPVTLNFGSYRYFFEGQSSSIMVNPAKVQDILEYIFTEKYRPITLEEKRDIIENFRWKDSCGPFWKQVMGKV